ncbi:MAG: hypothetical protein WB676_25875, partial [Bryobacteraceae bacterium]
PKSGRARPAPPVSAMNLQARSFSFAVIAPAPERYLQEDNTMLLPQLQDLRAIIRDFRQAHCCEN